MKTSGPENLLVHIVLYSNTMMSECCILFGRVMAFATVWLGHVIAHHKKICKFCVKMQVIVILGS